MSGKNASESFFRIGGYTIPVRTIKGLQGLLVAAPGAFSIGEPRMSQVPAPGGWVTRLEAEIRVDRRKVVTDLGVDVGS